MASLIPLAFIVDSVGGSEMMLIFVIVLVLFGGKKLPEFARGLGKTIREFKKAASGVEEEFKRALEEDERAANARKVLPTAPTPTALPPASTPASPPTPAPAPDASLTTPPPPPAPDTPPPAPDHPDAKHP